MRCYFMRDGHIAGVEEMPSLTDEEAVQKARSLFAARKDKFKFDGFEVWELARVVIQEPPTAPGRLAGEVIPFPSKRQASK
jgi:hypothetical protein